jgi:hypothetical protein
MRPHSDSLLEDFVNRSNEDRTVLELKCYECLKMKPCFDFYRDKCTKRGYKNYCKECLKLERKLKKERQEIHPDGAYLVTPEIKASAAEAAPPEESKKRKEPPTETHADESDPKKNKRETSDGKPINEVLSHRTLDEIPLLNFPDAWRADKNYAAAFVAPRESGKSTMIKHLYPYFRSSFDKIIFFTKSYQADIYDFLDKKDKNFIITHWDLRVLKYLEYLQRKTDNAFRFLIIFDDMLNKGGMRNSETILDMFTRGRNMNCSIIISMQSCSYLHPDSRKNLDFAFLLGVRTKEDSDSMYERLMEGIMPVDPDLSLRKQKNLFFEWMKEVTKDYWCLFVNYRKDADGNRLHKIKAPNA